MKTSTLTALKQTPFYNDHLALGAKMVNYAGFEMPVQYAGILAEHLAVRQKCGIFDVSHMGEFLFEGPQAQVLLQRLVCNDVSKIKIHQAQYSAMLLPEGGIIDDLIIYRLTEQSYMMVVNAANMEKDWNWVNDQNKLGVTIENISNKTALLAVQGPKAAELLQALTPVVLKDIPFYHFEIGNLAGVDNVIISATGYTGSGGFELYFDHEYAAQIWQAISTLGVEPCGLASRDTLRLEKGYCLYGNDITEETTPLEAGLSWITKFDTDFIGKEALLKQKEQGVDKKLVAFKMEEKAIPRKDYIVCDEQGEHIGKVTSGTQSPILKEGVGLAYVDKAWSAQGSKIFIEVRNKKFRAQVVKLPFV